MSGRSSPPRKGMEKFRKIPSLASERSRRKSRLVSDGTVQSITPSTDVSNGCTADSSILSEDLESNLEKRKLSADSCAGSEVIRPISKRSVRTNTLSSATARPKSSNLMSTIASRFSARSDISKQSTTPSEVENFSLANDQSTL